MKLMACRTVAAGAQRDPNSAGMAIGALAPKATAEGVQIEFTERGHIPGITAEDWKPDPLEWI
jgi:hypothetical protein